MKFRHSLMIIATFILFGSSIATAGHHYHSGCGMISSWDMSQSDANQDNLLSFEEFSARHLEHLRAGFNMIDTDGDGFISEEEWKTLQEVHGVENPS